MDQHVTLLEPKKRNKGAHFGIMLVLRVQRAPMETTKTPQISFFVIVDPTRLPTLTKIIKTMTSTSLKNTKQNSRVWIQVFT